MLKEVVITLLIPSFLYILFKILKILEPKLTRREPPTGGFITDIIVLGSIFLTAFLAVVWFINFMDLIQTVI